MRREPANVPLDDAWPYGQRDAAKNVIESWPAWKRARYDEIEREERKRLQDQL